MFIEWYIRAVHFPSNKKNAREKSENTTIIYPADKYFLTIALSPFLHFAFNGCVKYKSISMLESSTNGFVLPFPLSYVAVFFSVFFISKPWSPYLLQNFKRLKKLLENCFCCENLFQCVKARLNARFSIFPFSICTCVCLCKFAHCTFSPFANICVSFA